MKTLLKQNIGQHISLSEKETEAFCNLFEQKLIPKKSFLLREGEICKFEGFVVKGLFRVYHIDQDGFEQVLYFAIENWWITDIDSFTTETPSQLFIEALEDSEVLVISKKDKEFAYDNLPKIEKLFRVMTQKTHVALQRRMIDKIMLPVRIRSWLTELTRELIKLQANHSQPEWRTSGNSKTVKLSVLSNL